MGTLMKLLDVIAPKPPAIPELSTLQLEEETDVRGWTTGIVLDKRQHQGTVSFSLSEDSEGVITEDQWLSWEDSIARLDRMICTCTIDEAGDYAAPSRSATTFKATSKEQKKNLTELVTDISVRQKELYEKASAQELPLRPIDADELTRTVLSGLELGEGSWDDLASMELEETNEYLRVLHDGEVVQQSSVFTVDISEPAVAQAVDEVMQDWAGDELLRRTRFFRPYVLPEGTGENLTTGSGRRWALITLSGTEAGDWAFRQVMDANPVIGLQMRRLRGRQRTGVLAGLGIGVLGWQHLAAAQRKAA